MTGKDLSTLLAVVGFALVMGGYAAMLVKRFLLALVLFLGAAGLLIYWGWGLN